MGFQIHLLVAVTSSMPPTFQDSSVPERHQSTFDGLVILVPSALCSGRRCPCVPVLPQECAKGLCLTAFVHDTLSQLTPDRHCLCSMLCGGASLGPNRTVSVLLPGTTRRLRLGAVSRGRRLKVPPSAFLEAGDMGTLTDNPASRSICSYPRARGGLVELAGLAPDVKDMATNAVSNDASRASARTQVWYPGCVAWKTSRLNHSVNFSRDANPHDLIIS